MDDDLTSVPDRPPAEDSAATVLSGGETSPLLPASINELGSKLQGKRLGDYQLNEFVGGGGMGAVFKALDTTLDRVVAVKVLAGHRSTDEEMLRRFRNEAQSAARLNHENIGLVHAVGSSDGWHYIVFEYIEGTNLRDIVRQQGPLSAAAVLDISLQVAAALEHAAERNVTHRDIKPSNIIITPAGRAKLVDMGLARLQHVAGEQDLTVSGMTLGTFDYISPEQARDARAADIRSDLYSLGCTMFFMLVGRAPFAEGTMVQKLLQHQQELPPPIESLRADVPPRLALVMRRLMAKQPADRFQRPASLEAELRSIAEEEGIDLSVLRPALDQGAATVGRNGIVWPWLVAASCLASLVAWLALMGSHEKPLLQPSSGDGWLEQSAVGSAAATVNVRRVVRRPAGESDYSTVAAAVAAAVDGDVIEVTAEDEHVLGPLRLDGKSLTVRAAPGRRPQLWVDESLFPVGEGSQAVWLVSDGQLDIQGIDIRLERSSTTTVASRSMFWLTAGATLRCRDVGLVLEVGPLQEDSDGPLFDRIVTVAMSRPPDRLSAEGDAGGAEPVPTAAGREQGVVLEMTNVMFNGDATWCRVEGGSKVSMRWTRGSVTTSGRFLDVLGNASLSESEEVLSLDLEDATFACQRGFARLTDTPVQSTVPRLEATVSRCRFLVPEPSALLEQVGVAEPEIYQAAIDWQDSRGRYEGSRCYRRIDGAGDPIEIDYSSAGRPLLYQPGLNVWPGENLEGR